MSAVEEGVVEVLEGAIVMRDGEVRLSWVG